MIGLLRWISLGTSCGIVYSLTAVAVRVLVGFKGFKHPSIPGVSCGCSWVWPARMDSGSISVTFSQY